ncbi:hypothetical protein PSTT_10083 [Puccinia striiformis]|uniref:Uncharacterized protein n=2 Tax=Puccinia striiformis TaxID=27350 RepID=A0A0L0VF36_9BASI|nr:hypothetical protein PSTG_08912 [Puccinia striiformis f. sp. tritici PST-78]POW04867.1 hypothetical protein PSTT_10083 [Puccinia striiformis]
MPYGLAIKATITSVKRYLHLLLRPTPLELGLMAIISGNCYALNMPAATSLLKQLCWLSGII